MHQKGGVTVISQESKVKVCREANEECSIVSECCAPADLGRGTSGGPKTCQVKVCQEVNEMCSSASECCNPRIFCTGPAEEPQTCQGCRGSDRQACKPSGIVETLKGRTGGSSSYLLVDPHDHQTIKEHFSRQ
jgi:hypothetical protein